MVVADGCHSGRHADPRPNKPCKGQQNAGGPTATGAYNPDAPLLEPTGHLQPIASRILMKMLYAARMCRYDLLEQSVAWPAAPPSGPTNVTPTYNGRSFTLKPPKTKRWWVGVAMLQTNWSSKSTQTLTSLDARAMRSTTTVTLAVEGPNTRTAINVVSKRQTAVTHSTPDAEIVAADDAMRQKRACRL
jgi:hypothetical protein